jgi:hypothetical protein
VPNIFPGSREEKASRMRIAAKNAHGITGEATQAAGYLRFVHGKTPMRAWHVHSGARRTLSASASVSDCRRHAPGPLGRINRDPAGGPRYRWSPARLALQQRAYGEEMMHQFLTANRTELIARCRAKVALRAPPGVPEEELAHGVSIFLDQLIKTLVVEQTTSPLQSRRVSGPAGGGKPVLSEIGESATLHGKELQAHGFTMEK